MRRVFRWIVRILLGFAALTALIVAGVFVGLNTGAGRALVERMTPRLTGGTVRIEGLAGRFPNALRAQRILLVDGGGTWLEVDGAALDWAPTAVVQRRVVIDSLTADKLTMTRPPQPSASPAPAKPGGPIPDLPVDVIAKSVRIATLSVGPGIAGTPVTASIVAQGHLDRAASAGAVSLNVRTLGAAGNEYRLEVSADQARLDGSAVVRETEQPLVASLAGAAGIGLLRGDVHANGAWDAVAVALAADAGPARVTANGTIDVPRRGGDLAVVMTAPALRPMANVSWNGLTLHAQARGTLTQPALTGKLDVEGIEAGGAAVQHATATLTSDADRTHLDSTIVGLRLPEPAASLLSDAPVAMTADARLSDPARPLTFSVRHPRISIAGDARLQAAGGQPVAATATITLPDLEPFSTVAGTALAGHATVSVDAQQDEAGADRVRASSNLGLTQGPGPSAALIGDDAHLSVAVNLAGRDVTVSEIAIEGRALAVAGSGALHDGAVSSKWQIDLPNLSAVTSTLLGSITARGQVSGKLDALSLAAKLDGAIGTSAIKPSRFNATVDATGLPSAPTGSITANGDLLGAPLDVAAALSRDTDGRGHLKVKQANWKSIAASGALALPPGATIPLGQMTASIGRLADLTPLTGAAVGGAVSASIQSKPDRAHLSMTARELAIPATVTIGTAALVADVTGPTDNPAIDARLDVTGIAARSVGPGMVHVVAKGQKTALDIRGTADAGLNGGQARVSASSVLDAVNRVATIGSVDASWQGVQLRTVGPARVAFASGVSVDHLRVASGGATLDVKGRVSPELDATIVADGLTPALVTPFMPAAATIDGTLQLNARLTGAAATPSGTARLSLTGLHARRGPASALPPANASSDITLNGRAAEIRARLDVGPSTRVAALGQLPLAGGGPINVGVTGTINVGLANPILAADGREAHGIISLDSRVTGSAAHPIATGSVSIRGGEFQDVVQGVRLSNVTGVILGQGEMVRIQDLTAQAGPGRVAINGTVGTGAGIPIDIRLTAKNARPLAGDLVTADLDADLSLRGAVDSGLNAAGRVTIDRADIRIPERLPPSVAVLNVRRPGQAPPPASTPAPPAAPIGLDLTVTAPGRIFVRGRGVDAELGGSLHLGGTVAAPIPTGGFTLRRGVVSLAGQTLTFNKGQVGFNSGNLSDPSLDFAATAVSGGITATLGITGTAKEPKFALTSLPALPQDEVLSHLLFGRSSSQLSPFELAQIATTLASLTGVDGVGDPLDQIRSGLGLDRLSVGSGPGGSGTALQAGRYVAPGVYVGARQGLSGTGTQATVQVDIARGLKLEGAVGTSSGAPANGTTVGSGTDAGGSSVGLTYQFEY